MSDPTGDLGLTRADAGAIVAWLVVFVAAGVATIVLIVRAAGTARRMWRSRRRP